MNAVAGLVLCGGQSRRMGRPKAWLPFGDEFLLQLVVRVVGEAVGRVIVVAAKNQTLPPLPDFVKRVDDRVSGHGPLAGLATGLAEVDRECEAVYLTACDVPFLTTAFVRRVVESLNDSTQLAAVPFADGFHPLAAAYRTSVRPIVERRLADGELRMKDFIAAIPHFAFRVTSTPERENLRNVNSPEDYEAALTADATIRPG